MCGAEREKDCPAQADSTAFILHATADKALVLPDRGHKSPLGDAVPTAYTIPDDKHTIIHTAQHFFSPLSLGLAGAQVTTRGSEETCKSWKSAGTAVGRSRGGRRCECHQAIPVKPAAVEGTRATGAAAGEGHREERPSRGRSSPAERAPVGKPVIFTRCRMELGQLQGGMGLGKHHQHAGLRSSRRMAKARHSGPHSCAPWRSLCSLCAAHTGPAGSWGGGLSCRCWASSTSSSPAVSPPEASELQCWQLCCIARAQPRFLPDVEEEGDL